MRIKTYNRSMPYMATQKLSTVTLIIIALIGCNKDNPGLDNPVSFEYSISGDVSSDISGGESDFFISTPTGSGTSKTIIQLKGDNANLFIRINFDNPVKGTFPINNEIGSDPNGNPIIVALEEGEAIADMQTGGALTQTARSFHTRSANGGTVKLTSVNANSIEGIFDISLITIGGPSDLGPLLEVGVAGKFIALKQ